MENKNDYNFWGRAIAGIPANATQTVFSAQVAKNVLAIRLADFQGDLQQPSLMLPAIGGCRPAKVFAILQ